MAHGHHLSGGGRGWGAEPPEGDGEDNSRLHEIHLLGCYKQPDPEADLAEAKH